MKYQYIVLLSIMLPATSFNPIQCSDAQQDTIVAAFYYPWYSSSPAIHWPEGYLREDLVPAQPPLIGEYTSTSSTVLEQHIAWSETYGIDAWIVSWWGTDSWEENALSSSVQQALNGSNIRFTIIYESGILPSWNWDNSSTRIRFKDDMLYLAETYFNHPNYLRIDDRPVIYVYVTRGFYGDHTRGMQEARTALLNAGHDVFFIADGVDAQNSLAEYDALSNYLTLEVGGCMLWDGSYPNDNSCVASMEQRWTNYQVLAQNAGIHFIPNIAPGFNKNGWGSNPNEFWVCPPRLSPESSHTSVLDGTCDLALTYMDSSLRMVTLTSFNEWHEDTQVEPTIVSDTTSRDNNNGQISKGYAYKGYGTDRLEVILSKFGGASEVYAAVDDESHLPGSYKLQQNHPNPFNPSTTIPFELPLSTNVNLSIYDILGREVSQVIDGFWQGGYHQVIWNGRTAIGREVPTGIYIARLVTPEYTKFIKMVLLK